MAVTINKSGKTIKKFPVKKPKPKPNKKFAPPLKLPEAIENQKQLSVEVPVQGKVAIKMLAARLGITMKAMIADALTEIVKAPPPEIFSVIHFQPTTERSRFPVYVAPEIYQQVCDLAEARDVCNNAILWAALEHLIKKYDVAL